MQTDEQREVPRVLIIEMIDRLLQEQAPAERWNITLLFTDDENLTDLNRRYFAIDAPTDVISFDLTDDDEAREGEIYISVETAVENAQEYGVTLANELCRLAAHGVLHLLGYDDATENDRLQMTFLENKALENILWS